MKKYYLCKNPRLNGEYRIHTTDCPFLPEASNRIFLGNFGSGSEALDEAKKYRTGSNGCIFCLKTQFKAEAMKVYESILGEI